MISSAEITELLQGPLLEPAEALPLTINTILCDLRPRFLTKCRAGRGFRSISRNGRILLASALPLDDLTGQEVRLRFQIWHKTILPDAPAEPYGLLVCADAASSRAGEPSYNAYLVTEFREPFDLAVDVGGRVWCAFRRIEEVALKNASRT
jgi:hypothetical protein